MLSVVHSVRDIAVLCVLVLACRLDCADCVVRTVQTGCADCVGRLFCGQTVQSGRLTEWDSGHHKGKI